MKVNLTHLILSVYLTVNLNYIHNLLQHNFLSLCNTEKCLLLFDLSERLTWHREEHEVMLTSQRAGTQDTYLDAFPSFIVAKQENTFRNLNEAELVKERKDAWARKSDFRRTVLSANSMCEDNL